MHAIERRLARTARELADDRPRLRLRVPERPPAGPVAPTDAQWRAVRNALEHRLSILTGLPGTGKTQTMRALVDLLAERGRTVRLCAPTGKAARRLGELTGAQATTIHRLLEYVPGEGFARGPEDPITGTDVLIVDEASMLSVRLADALLGAVGPRTHVLLVGDVDQLAPVGPGRVLEDLVESGAVPTVHLTAIFRQAARSLIIRAAHAINRGEPPPTIAGPDDVRDFFVIERDGAEAVFADVCDIAARRLPDHYGFNPRQDILVLSPMHKGPLGIAAFNQELRRRLNPNGSPVGMLAFRIGDRVVQRKNDHEHQLMNGETGTVIDASDERERVTLRCDDGRVVRLPFDACATLELGYCLSVHRAQGSQNRAVVMPVWSAHAVMLSRNLLYTGLTRAQELAVFVGESRAILLALRRTDAARRFTRLTELVHGASRAR
jgi:exodeoxyribonuclease V alpha subunit